MHEFTGLLTPLVRTSGDSGSTSPIAAKPSQRGRQVLANGSMIYSVRLTLVPGRDDDLIAVFENTPRGSLASRLRHMLRSGAQGGDEFGAGVEMEIDLGGMEGDL